MADKKPEDYRKVDVPKADSLFFNPNTLEDLLQDLTDFEDWSHTDNLYQDDDGSLKVEEHDPYEDAEKAKKIKADKSSIPMVKKDVETLDEKNIRDILEDYTDYENYLGIIDKSLPKVKDTLVNRDEFPMDTEPKIAND